ncbi:FAD/FMN-containing Dehydrogenase [Yersinia mollaretii ATCC 43969]|uniref:FAD/FMN-containing Dehydrogenase n=1 Tax=Yersinia mollaretii (strain ATCC 43969 / DSM 18520 / CIP 103324 / CNY 7263 / WAIP 204) TaxID=349967 RepID=A0ABM9YCG6_YERMW|nr:FAD/FMN-containing Dehydrogenase [Yersinia mollaretii ATCC 43969]
MIPQISQAPGVVQLVLDFLDALKQNGFTGDTATNYADRLTMATDNSIYQLLPDAVLSHARRLMSHCLAAWQGKRILNL